MSTDTPRLGVVIPCYNHERYIGKAIESVLDQTRKADRFLVIDDGSADQSVAVIRGYEDRGVECITQENAGAHNTINRAIELVAEDCDLISILNSDDHYTPDRFEKCLPEFDNPDTDVVVSNLRMIDPDDEPLEAEESRAKWLRAVWSMGDDPDLSNWKWMAMANFPNSSSNIVARAAYLRANPFRPYRFNHDYFFLAGAAIRNRIAVVRGDPMLNYRVHPENNINSAPAPLLKEMLRMHADLYRHLIATGELEGADSGDTRRRFYEFAHATWSSVSAFHAGLFQLVMAKVSAAGAASDDEVEAIIKDLDESLLTELNDYPNKALINHWDGKSPIHRETGLAEKFQTLSQERAELKAELAAAKELAKLRNELLKSKSLSAKRLIGTANNAITNDSGKTAQEKLANLKRALGDR
jgi:glycosyltransferase involved in cell wall biosynthesis